MVFKYKVQNPIPRPNSHYYLFLIPVLALVSLKFEVIFISLLLTFFVFFKIRVHENALMLFSRYLICGKDIIYFADIQSVEFDQKCILIQYEGGRVYKIMAHLFETNARKEHKIQAHRAKKIQKTYERIQSHLPSAEANHAKN